MNKKSKRIILLITVTVLGLGYMHLETYLIKINRISFSSENIPESFQNKTIVFISDVHHGPYVSQKRVAKAVNKINALKPDIVVLGGDYIDLKAKYIDPVFDELEKLKAPLGVYAVLGNHEYWEDELKVKQRIQKAGFNACDNASYWVRLKSDSIKIGGVGDLWEAKQDIDQTINDVDESDFCVLISHNPDYIETMQTQLVDLTLSGHTHGGQVTFFGLWAPILPTEYGQKYRYGYKQFDHTKAYITSGVGVVGVPFRFFSQPEIAVLKLKKQEP